MKKSSNMVNFNEYRKYKEQLEEDKKLSEKYTLIDNGFLIHDNLNILKLPNIPSDIDNIYSLHTKLMNIYRYINITNELICESNKIFEQIKENENIINFYNTYLFSKLDKLNEYIIHDIKMYTDDLVALIWVLTQDEYPKKILIGKVSTYINKYNEKDTSFNVFDNYINFFIKINSLDNAIKHSYKKTMDSGSIGNEKNCIVVFDSKNGSLESNDILVEIIDETIQEFNDFFRYSVNLIQKFVDESR